MNIRMGHISLLLFLMRLDPEFFELQWLFCLKVAKMCNQSVLDALLRHSNFYIRLGLGRDFDSTHPVWQEFLKTIEASQDPVKAIYEYYLKRRSFDTGPVVLARAGCFSYGIVSSSHLQLHFETPEHVTGSCLGTDQHQARILELHDLFLQIKESNPTQTFMKGSSWLYNLKAYASLFPDTYLASSQIIPARFHSLSLWGQFVHQNGNLNQNRVKLFLDRLEGICHPTQFGDCFPLQIKALEAPIESFKRFYDKKVLEETWFQASSA